SHRLGIIDHDKCRNLLENLIESFDPKAMDKVKSRLESISDYNEQIAYLRAKSIGQLIKETSNAFQQQIDLILNGNLEKPLLDFVKENNGDAKKILNHIEEFSIENIYNHHSVVEIENAGFNVMHELLSHFIEPILKNSENRSKSEQKAVKLIPLQLDRKST